MTVRFFTGMSRCPLFKGPPGEYSGGVKTRPLDRFESEADEYTAADSALRGLVRAVAFARAGRLISAIKWIEANNEAITREQAKAVVRSFGYGREVRWPKPEKLPVRLL